MALGRHRLIAAAGLGIGLVALLLGSISLYLCLDKTQDFYDVRGTYAGAEVLEVWRTGRSDVRRIALHNREAGAVVEAYVRRPLALDPDYRIVISYAGAKTGRKILELVPERNELVLVAIQYPYRSPDGVTDHLLWPRRVRQAGFRTVAGGMLAVTHMQQDLRLDTARLVLLGSSLGSIFATIHGALDERVPVVVLIHGGGDLAGLVRHKVTRPWLSNAASFGAGILFHSFEPLRYVGRISPRELVMISARHDAVFDRHSSERLLARAGEPKQIIWTDSGHVRTRRTELLADIIRDVQSAID